MALKLLREGESARQVGCIWWLEDLERAGLTYGDLLGFLEDCGMPCVVSPVHNRDKYTAQDVKGWLGRHEEYLDRDTGEIAPEHVDKVPRVGDSKKEHIHGYFKSKGPKKGPDWSELVSDFYPIAPNRWVKVPDWDYIVRYCAHMDAPNKAQYDPLTVRGFGNVDVSALMNVTKVNKYAVIAEINEYIEKNKIRHFHRLNKWAMGTGDVNIIACVTGRASYFNAIFSSIAAENAQIAEQKKGKQ